MIIEDGKGNRVAWVNQRNELRVQAAAAQLPFIKAISGQTFAVATGFVNVSVAGGRMLWLKNNEQAKLMVVHKMYISWNGGNTNHNRGLKVIYYANDSEPSANAVEVTPGPTLIGATTTVELVNKVWTGVGDGMTIDTPGTAVGFALMGPGYTQIEIENTFMVSPGVSICVNLQGEEAGVATFGGRVFMLDPEKDEWT